MINARLVGLQQLRLARFGGHLKKLCLRQNLINSLNPETFNTLGVLEELDLYDNRLKHVDGALDACTKLRWVPCEEISSVSLLTGVLSSVLDLSFNLLHAVPESVEKLVALRTVYFVQNRISRIDRLSTLGANLRSLELGANRIRVRSPVTIYMITL